MQKRLKKRAFGFMFVGFGVSLPMELYVSQLDVGVKRKILGNYFLPPLIERYKNEIESYRLAILEIQKGCGASDDWFQSDAIQSYQKLLKQALINYEELKKVVTIFGMHNDTALSSLFKMH